MSGGIEFVDVVTAAETRPAPGRPLPSRALPLFAAYSRNRCLNWRRGAAAAADREDHDRGRTAWPRRVRAAAHHGGTARPVRRRPEEVLDRVTAPVRADEPVDSPTTRRRSAAPRRWSPPTTPSSGRPAGASPAGRSSSTRPSASPSSGTTTVPPGSAGDRVPARRSSPCTGSGLVRAAAPRAPVGTSCSPPSTRTSPPTCSTGC